MNTCSVLLYSFIFFFSSRRRHTRLQGDWSSDVCSSDLGFASSRVAGLAHHFAACHCVGQPHGAEQVFYLQPGGDMRHGWARAERDFIEIIDGGQSAWVKLAEDYPLGHAFNAAEIKLLRKLLQPLAHQTL